MKGVSSIAPVVKVIYSEMPQMPLSSSSECKSQARDLMMSRASVICLWLADQR